MTVKIMEHIWSGTMELRDGTEFSPLARLFRSLLATPMIYFTLDISRTNTKPFAIFAGDEVMLGASLSDVLYEEFGIEVSDETIVLFEPSSFPKERAQNSEELGLALGSVLVNLANSSRFEIPTQPTPSRPFIEPQIAKRRMQVESIQ